MKALDPKNVKNLGLYGHGGVGKTTLLETILFNLKQITRIGAVEAGNTTCDYFDDEIKVRYTLRLKPTYIETEGKRLHIIDNPGSLDFSGEVAASSRVVDTMVILVDVATGIQLGAEKAYEYALKYNIPKIIFVNKLDKEHTDFFECVDKLKENWGNKITPVALPKGKDTSLSKVSSLLNPSEGKDIEDFDTYRTELMEKVAESDDKLLEKFLETMELSEEEFTSGMVKALAQGKIIPVFCGSVSRNIGINEFVSFLANTCPSLVDREKVQVGETTVEPNLNAQFSAMVFKNLIDPFVGQLTFFKVYSGKLTTNTNFYNITQGTEERFGQIFFFQGKKQIPVEELGPGDIAAVAKLKSTKVNDTLGVNKQQKIAFPAIEFPKPMVRLAAMAETRKDEDKIGEAIRKIADEDPTFKVVFDTQTRETVMMGMGDSHLNMMIDKLKTRYQVSVKTKLPRSLWPGMPQ